MDRLLSRTLCAALLALAFAPAARAADPPPLTVPADPSLMSVAQGVAVAHWGMNPCGGQVAVSWDHMGDGVNARSQWMTTNEQDPTTYSSCSINYNLDVDWDWPKLCTVVEHEMGHLTGHSHVFDDPANVMSPYYTRPSPECVATPQPGLAPQAPSAAPTAKPASATQKAKPRKKAKKAKHLSARQRALVKARQAKARAKARAQARSQAKSKSHLRVAVAASSDRPAVFFCALV